MLHLRSLREIKLMRRAGLVVYHAHQMIASLVKPGVTTGEIDAAVERFFRQKKVVPLFKGVPGKVPFPAVTCISVNDEIVHGIPGKRVLDEGDVVSIDTGCKLDGWCGDGAWTYAVGNVRPEHQKLLDVGRDTLFLAISLMGKCMYWSQVAAQMEAFVHQHGMYVVEDLVGHGIGRTMWEDPQVPNYVSEQLRQGQDFKLSPGLVIAVEPMVNLGSKKIKLRKDHWTQVTGDGSPSVHFEHTIAMTDHGPWVLTTAPGPMDEKMGFTRFDV